MKELISVVVPVYRSEKYLDKCIESIVAQTYRNLEIILIDDGSPDNCPRICDMWAEKDDRIKVFHVENNGGGAMARNIGLNAAKGEIISFIDSDDYISPYMYEYLAELMTDDVDISECEMLITSENLAEFDNPSFEDEVLSCSSIEAMKHHIVDSIFRQTPPNKLYRKSAIGDIRFVEGKKIDDEFFTYRVIGSSRRLVHSPCRLYAYRQQGGSVMNGGFSLFRLQAIEAKVLRLKYIEERYPELIPDAKMNLFDTCLFLGQMAIINLDKKEQKMVFCTINKIFKENKPVFVHIKNKNFKYKLWFFISCFSIKNCCKIRNFMKIGI